MAPQISEKYKCIFVHIPKAAGSSIEQSSIFQDQRIKFKEYVGGHTTAIEYREKYPDLFKEYFKFSLVRNPFSRLVSAYCYLLKGGSGNRYDTRIFKKYFENSDRNFISFCRNQLSKEMVDEVVHLRPQFKFLCDDNMTILVDFIGKQENFSQDAKKIFQKVGLKYERKHSLKSSNKHFSEYYEKDIQDKVFELYQPDFELFGYQSEIGSYNRLLFTVDKYFTIVQKLSSKAWRKTKLILPK